MSEEKEWEEFWNSVEPPTGAIDFYDYWVDKHYEEKEK